MVPVSIFVLGSHKDFNERTHAYYAGREMTSATRLADISDTPVHFDSILVSLLISKKKKVRDLKPLTCALDGGRYKIRTCDPIRVKDMLYP